MSELEDLEPVLLVQARNNRVQQNWGNKGDASRVKLIHVKKGTYNEKPASLVVLHFHLAVKILKQADFTIRILPEPSATDAPAPAELSAAAVPPPNDPALHLTLPPAPPELSAAIITNAPPPANIPAVHFASPPEPVGVPTAVATKAPPPANSPAVHFALPPREGELRRKESPHVQLVAFGPRHVKGPTREVRRDLEYEEQKRTDVEVEHARFKFWKRKDKVAEHYPNSLGGTIDVYDEQSWIRLSAIKSDLKKGGCPQRFTFAFVVRHSRPIRLLVRPCADIKRLATWKEPVMTCLEKYTQADQPQTCTGRNEQGAALCDHHCAEFNHLHMTSESWKRLLVMDDLQKWDWEENNQDGAWVKWRGGTEAVVAMTAGGSKAEQT